MKMKAYSIGREVGCDIVITDNSDVISRRHAILNVMSSGKMTIVDQSHNGTYVNGIRIAPNVPVPVTRKDNISFAHISRLDWNMIPKPTNYLMYVVIAIVALLLIIGAIFAICHFKSEPKPMTTPTDSIQKNVIQEPTTKEDSCLVCKKKISDCAFKGQHPTPEVKKQKKDVGKKTDGKGKRFKADKNKGKGKPANKENEVSNGARH